MTKSKLRKTLKIAVNLAWLTSAAVTLAVLYKYHK